MSLEQNKTNLGGLTENDIKVITGILEQQAEVEQAILFGSRAKGNYKNGSDVDIALKGRNINFKTTSHISYLLNEETQLPYKFDVLNYNSTEKDVVEHIARIGIEFYKK